MNDDIPSGVPEDLEYDDQGGDPNDPNQFDPYNPPEDERQPQIAIGADRSSDVFFAAPDDVHISVGRNGQGGRFVVAGIRLAVRIHEIRPAPSVGSQNSVKNVVVASRSPAGHSRVIARPDGVQAAVRRECDRYAEVGVGQDCRCVERGAAIDRRAAESGEDDLGRAARRSPVLL